MRSPLFSAFLLLAFTAPAVGLVDASATPPSPVAVEAASGPGMVQATASLAAAPGASAESVEPAERASEPEGVFGFARLALGLVVAVILGAGLLLGSRLVRRHSRHQPPRP